MALMNAASAFRKIELTQNEFVLGYENEPIDEVVRETLLKGAIGFLRDSGSGFGTRLNELKSIRRSQTKLLSLSMTALVPSGEADLLFEVSAASRSELQGAQRMMLDMIARSTKCERHRAGLEAVVEECFLNLGEHVFKDDGANASAKIQCHGYPGGVWLLCRDSLGLLTPEGLKAAYVGRAKAHASTTTGGYGLAVILSNADTVIACSKPGNATVIASRFQSKSRADDEGDGKSFLLWSSHGD
jgi:hypothetical protein